MCFIKGILLINHSPSQKTVAPIHDEAKIPIKSIKSREVTNPRPAKRKKYSMIPYKKMLFV